jgi:glycosyltransferase involved in cell wall biosynthesis
MINLFFVIHDHSGARTYGNELLNYFSELENINVYKIFYESRHYKEYIVIQEGNITEVHLPLSKTLTRSLEKYAVRCLDLMQPLVSGKENVIFHLNFSNQVKLGVKARERFGAKIIYTLHFLPDFFSYIGYNNDWQDDLETKGDALEREVTSVADRVICVTRFAKQAICRCYKVSPQKVEAIHNGFSNLSHKSINNFESNTAIRKRVGFGKNEKIILFVGLLESRKGISFLIRAFNQLTDIFPNVRLVIAGNGDFKEALSHIKKGWAKITFMGNIPYNELEKLYGIATVGVIPSVFEQCSYVALEMMKYGLPVVVAAAPGLRELYTHEENALIVPLLKIDNNLMKLELNEERLTEYLVTVLNDNALLRKLSINARSNWEQNYNTDRMGDATINQYKLLLS